MSPHKISQWDTGLCLVGWDIDTLAMAIYVPLANLERLRDTLGLRTANLRLRYLTRWLLHPCKVMRVGKFIVRRLPPNVGLCPVRAWDAKFYLAHTSAASSPCIRLGSEIHADVPVWRLFVAGGLASPAGRFSAPLYRSYMHPPAFSLWLHASGDAVGGYFVLGPEPGLGVWWCSDFDDDVRERLRASIRD